jgi:hypothetical protein
MNRINAIMVYAVIIIWTGIVLLHGISSTVFSASGYTGKDKAGRIVTSEHYFTAPGIDHRLNSLTPLYY